MEWFEINVTSAPDLRDTVANHLFEIGAEGVQEVEHTGLTGYFRTEKRDEVSRSLEIFISSIAEIFPEQPAVTFHIRTVKDEAWAEKYKETYFAQPLTKLFYLQPAWDHSATIPEGMIPIRMDPGQAFGTGLHPSTQLCLRLIERTLDRYPDVGSVRLLDVGTGSGILAIAAEKLGIGKVIGTDNDPLAVDVARENAAINGSFLSPGRLSFNTGEIAAQGGNFDIVVANILLEAHRELAAEYARSLKPGGQLILSGLLTQQRQEIDQLFTSLGFQCEVTETQQEWLAVGYWLRKS